MSMGRPSTFSQEVADMICARTAEGEFVQDICREPGMPHVSTFWRWRAEREDLRKSYAHARELQAAEVARQAYARAVRAEDAQIDRLAYDAGKWMAAKLDPANYGDKVQHANAAGDGDQVVKTSITVDFKRPGS